MKLLLPTLLISFFLLSVRGKAQTSEPANILGYAWGQSYKECLKQLKRSKIKCGGEKEIQITYKDAGSGSDIKLEFENGLAQVVKSRSFPKEQYEKSMEYFNRLLEDLVAKHGNYRNQKIQEKEILVFEWKFKATNMILMYYMPTNTITLEYSKI